MLMQAVLLVKLETFQYTIIDGVPFNVGKMTILTVLKVLIVFYVVCGAYGGFIKKRELVVSAGEDITIGCISIYHSYVPNQWVYNGSRLNGNWNNIFDSLVTDTQLFLYGI